MPVNAMNRKASLNRGNITYKLDHIFDNRELCNIIKRYSDIRDNVDFCFGRLNVPPTWRGTIPCNYYYKVEGTKFYFSLYRDLQDSESPLCYIDLRENMPYLYLHDVLNNREVRLNIPPEDHKYLVRSWTAVYNALELEVGTTLVMTRYGRGAADVYYYDRGYIEHILDRDYVRSTIGKMINHVKTSKDPSIFK